MRNAFSKSTASSLLTSDQSDISFLPRTTKRNGRIGLTHGGRPSQLEVHSAKQLRHHFVQVEALSRPHLSSPAQLDSAIREALGLKRLIRQLRNGLFYFNGVHTWPSAQEAVKPQVATPPLRFALEFAISPFPSSASYSCRYSGFFSHLFLCKLLTVERFI